MENRSNVFRIHKSGQNDLKGWQRSTPIAGNLINTIPDTLTDNTVLRKMGTSIPSPFARMFLFDAAFKMIKDNHDGNSPYHQLASECLDLIEFIYLRAKDPLLTIKKWDKEVELNSLKASNQQAHKDLSSMLKEHLDTILPKLKEIYLFFYDGILMGGTSPLTLVFTSPNWTRKKTGDFSGGIASQLLFAGKAVPLHKRSSEFREFIQKFRLACIEKLTEQGPSLYEYLQENFNSYDIEIKNNFNKAGLAAVYSRSQFINEYTSIKMIDGTFVTSGELPLAGKNITGGTIDSGYMIRPSVKYFENYTSNGAPVRIKTPLALTDTGLPNVAYLGGQPWNPNICKLHRNPDEALHERELPGGSGIKYPYLTDADFLEDTLIKVAYQINNQRFETCYDGESHYLLPLKKEYFKYFTLEDMRNQLKISTQRNGIMVTLDIPITDATYPKITFKKEYTTENIIECVDAKYFNLGFTPFYRVLDHPQLNDYCIMLGDNTDKVRLQFGTFHDVDTWVIPDLSRKRTNISQYIHLNHKTFDFIELSIGTDKALIIPRMTPIRISEANKEYLFSVDFGTTNTHISYSTDNGAKTHMFKIAETDAQVVFLNKLDTSQGNSGQPYWNSFGLPLFAARADREFVPALIGENSFVAYPYRTAVYETSSFKNGLDINLFGNISIGFLMLRESSMLTENNEYRTDLKWALEFSQDNITACENRVKAYCEQIAWMIKNKILLNHGKPQFTLILTFPGTMKIITKIQYLTFWQQACKKYFGPFAVNIQEESESVVPYYSFLKGTINKVSDAVNVDIGGGTTDMLFILNSKKRNKQFYTSSLFAANDLWGDGVSTPDFSKKDNGFIKLIDDAIDNGTITISKNELKNYYNSYKEIAQSSADVISFLFKYDDDFKLSSLIKKNNDLYALVFIHFAAILYHISQVATKIDMGIPTYLTFTGMGSKLIRLISTKEDHIRDLAKLLLEVFTNSSAPDLFTVKFASNPKEITAEGALSSQHPSIEKINPTFTKEYGFKNAKERYHYEDTPELKGMVIEEFNRFVKILETNTSIKDYLRKYDIFITSKLIEEINKYSDLSYELMANRNYPPGTPVNETLFFWPLKQTLYELTK